MSDISAGAFGGGSGGAGAVSSSSAAPANVDLLIRSGRRMEILQRYAPELVNSFPGAALQMAEGPEDDDTILRAASQTVGFANVDRIRRDLDEESPEVQYTMYQNLPETLREAIDQTGYQVPDRERERGSGNGRLFGSIPIVGDVVEPMLDWGELPGVGGAMEEAQHFLGEGMEGLNQGIQPVLNVLEWPSEQLTHTYRALKYIQEESPNAQLPDYFNPSQLAEAWENTDESDHYIRPGHRSRAMELVGSDRRLYQLAKATALNQTPEEIIEQFGFEPGSAEATELMQEYTTVYQEEAFREAIEQISLGQVSFGRTVAQDGWNIEDTNSGFGRMLSGAIDGGTLVLADPTLVLGKLTKGLRFGRWAFRMEEGEGIARGVRQADLALDALRAREGMNVGQHALPGLARRSPLDMRRGHQVLAWADRVAEGFRTGDIMGMTRDLPTATSAVSHMADYHSAVRRGAYGAERRGLDDTLGVIEYLQDREGLYAMAGTRLGGTSTMARGLRMPSITTRDRIAMRGRNAFQKSIDWSRFVGSTPEQVYGPAFRDVLSEVRNPNQMGRELQRWLGSKTIGSMGRAMSYLTNHTPYRDVLALEGNDAVAEFQRLTNLGLFAGASRGTLDAFGNAFANGDTATRSALTETFLHTLFTATGIDDTEFARRFIGAHRRAFALDTESRALRLVDGQHADVLAIPNVRQFLAGTYDANLTRMLFHNPGSAWIDAKLSQFWKPAVLLRLGFISRAAGEEMLHFALKHGPRTWLGAKGGEWAARAEASEVVRGQLRLAESAGHADEVNRLRQTLADLETGPLMGPVRSLMSAGDRMFTHLFESSRTDARPWRQALARKAERLDTVHTVSGLERFANELALRQTGFFGRIAQAAPGDFNRETIGRWMADHWNPGALEASRRMLRDPVVARAFAEDIAGSSLQPWEYRGQIDESGMPMRRVEIGEIRGGLPVVEEVQLRRVPDSYVQLDRVLDDPSMYRTLYQRQRAVGVDDRPGAAATRSVLPRYVGGWGEDLADRVGYRGDYTRLRSDLNDLWAHQRSAPAPTDEGMQFASGEEALNFLRRWVDGDEGARNVPTPAVVGALKNLADDAGVRINTSRYIGLLEDPMAAMPAKRWTLYDSVRTDDLIRDPQQLRRRIRHATRGRMARPDVYPQLRRTRLYARGEDTLALPTADGISKVYVPLMPPAYRARLNDDFVDLATDRIVRIGGYHPDVARQIAVNVRAAADEALIGQGVGPISMRPLAAWGASDPRVADAIMAAAEETTGIRPTFGILEVPDDIVTRATDEVESLGLRTQADSTGQIHDYLVDEWRLNQVTPTDQPRRYTTLQVGEEGWDDVALDSAVRTYRRPPAPGMVRRYSRDSRRWLKRPPKDGPFFVIDVPEGRGVHSAIDRRLRAAREEGRRAGSPTEMGMGEANPDANPLLQQYNFTSQASDEGVQEWVNLADVSPGQADLDVEYVEQLRADPEEYFRRNWDPEDYPGITPEDRAMSIPEVIRLPDGTLAMADGHHRAVAEAAERQGMFRARVHDVDETGAPVAPRGGRTEGPRPRIDDEAISEFGMHRLPGVPRKGDQPYDVSGRYVSHGLGEIHALERAADRTTDEVLEVLTTLGIDSTDDDVLHEIVEPMLRGDRRTIDDAGNQHFEPGYDFNHLMGQTSADRLPTRTWGPREVVARDLRWNRIVNDWFEGPVNRAISSLIRKPFFATVYGEQLRNSAGLIDMFIDAPTRQAAVAAFERNGLSPEDLDTIALDVVADDSRRITFIESDEIEELLDLASGGQANFDDVWPDLERFSRRRWWAERHVSNNALNRAVSITTPYIDDYRVRSAFQSYIGNFIPFHHAEEQFIKRWTRSVVENPEMIRKAQLAMNGFRSMGTVRRDEEGREYFNYPLVGDAMELMSKPIEWMTGGRMSIPYEIELTGDVGYTLPGFGDQMGVPSAGPLVGMSLEFLSRHYPELDEVEEIVNRRGSNRALWQYLVPTQMARMWEAIYGDIDQNSLASANLQAMQTMILNGQGPPEDATEEEINDFIERAKGQARTILFIRGMFGMAAPAAPQVEYEKDQLSDQFLEYLQADIPFEEAIQLFLASNPDMEPSDLLAATVFTTETEASGLEMPSDRSLNWMNDNADLLEAYPQGASWLIPRATAEDTFSQRAYNEQLARGMRKRKTPREFLNDIYFRQASQDYFERRQEIDARLLGTEGPGRGQIMREWSVWKQAYFNQHPVFADMLLDPSRQQGRRQALEELSQLSGRNDALVPDDMRQLLNRFEQYQLDIAGLRGDRRQAVRDAREEITGEFYTWAQWHINAHPSLSGVYLRLIEPELVDLDEDAVVGVTD